jgi:hypothetical protein
MTGAELQTTLEFLGLTPDWLATELNIDKRGVARMMADQRAIRVEVTTLVDNMASVTKRTVDRMIAKYRRQVKDTTDDVILVLTYRTDDLYRAADPDSEYPARWHRMVVARVCEAVPRLVPSYWELDDQPAID